MDLESDSRKKQLEYKLKMEAVLISGAQGLSNKDNFSGFQAYGEGNEGVRRCPGSTDGRAFPSFATRPRLHSDTRRGRFYSDVGSEGEGSLFSSQPDTVVIPLGRSVKGGGIRVRINVSGMIFETLEGTLSRFPSTLLGDPQKRRKHFDSKKREYFFDRNRFAFDAILYYYQSNGKLLRPGEIDMKTFISELEFFELGNGIVDQFRSIIDGDNIHPMPENAIQKKIWETLEYPNSSLAAKFIAVWSVFVILLSIALFCIETLPSLKDARADSSSPLNLLEIVIIAWFTLEYVLRFLMAPSKCTFVRSFLNLVDLMAILPYYVIVAMGDEASKKNTSLPAFFRILRLIRVLRIFKLSRHYRGLKVLGLTLKASVRELLLLAFFLGMGVIIFSSAVYYAESAHFSSIPEAFWWSVVTMTTVGYGDKTPTSAWGKVIGSLCAVSGVLTLALPVPVIVSNFSYYYNQDRERLRAGAPEVVPATKPTVDTNV